MRERDRLAALGEMAAGLAHEIRNPLGAIKGAAQCLDPQAAAGRGRRVPRRHRRGGQPAQRRGDRVPRLRAPAQAELRADRPQRGGHPHHAAHPERRARADRRWRCELGEALPRGRRRRRAAQAGAHQPGAERHPGAGRQARARSDPRAREARALRRLPRRRASSSRSHVTDDGPGIPAGSAAATSSCPSSPPSRRAPGWAWPSASASSRTTAAASRCRAGWARGRTFVIRLPALASAGATRVPEPPRDGTPTPGELGLRQSRRERARERRRRSSV